MTRFLLPVFVAIVALLGLITIVPIVIRELLYPHPELWADDLP